MSVSGIGSNNSVSQVFSNYVQHSTTGSTRVSVSDNSNISAFKDKNDGAPNLEELYNKKAQAEADLNELQSQSNDTQSQINDRTEEINNSIENGEQDTAVNADFDEAKADYDEAKAEYDEADADYTEAQADLDEAQAELDEAQTEFDEAQAEFDEAETAKVDAEQKLSTLESERASIESSIQVNQANQAINAQNLAVNASNIASTQAEISETESALASLSDGQGGDGKESADVANRRAALEAKLAELQAKLEALEAERAQLEAERDMLQAEAQNLYMQLSNNTAQINSTQAEITAQTAAMEAAQATMDEAQIRIDESQVTVDEAQTRMDEADSRRETAQADMDEAQSRMDEAEDAMREEDPELNEALTEDAELQELQETFDQLQKNAELKQQEISQIDMEIAEAEAKNASLKAAQATEADDAFEKAASEAGCSVAASAAEAKDNVAQQKYGKAYDELTKEEQLGIDTGIQGEITLDVMDKARQMLEENPNNKAAQDVLKKGQQSLDAHEKLAGATLNECLNNMSDEMKSGANAAMEHARAEARAQGNDPEQAAMQALTDFAEDNVSNPSLDAGEQAAIISVIGAAADYIDSTLQADKGHDMVHSFFDEIHGGAGSDVIYGRGGVGETRGPVRNGGGVGETGSENNVPAAGGLNRPDHMLSISFSVAQMQMTDYQNAEVIQEQIAYSTVQGSEHYDAIVKELADNGIEISTEADQQVDDIEASQAMLAAASTGMLDYEALEKSIEEAGEGSLSSYIGEKLLEAHNSGTPLEEIDFGTELLNPMPAEDAVNTRNASAASGSGMTTAFSVGRLQMIDYQNAQGLVEAAQRGYLDIEAVNAAAQGEDNLIMTGQALSYISETEANGGDYEDYTFEQYREDNPANAAYAQPANKDEMTELFYDIREKRAAENAAADGGEGDDTMISGGAGSDTISHAPGGLSTAFSVAQMQMTDYQNGQAVQEQILASTVHDPQQYDAIVEELAANGIEITTEADQKGDDIASCQAMIAAASTGMLDYDALAASLEEAGEGSLSAYIGEKLLEAHNSGTPLNEIDFGSEMLNPLSADSVATDAQPGAAGGVSTAFSVGRMQMIDYQNSQGLIEAVQRGLIDMDALSAAAQDAPGLTGEAMAYITEVEANGGDYEAYTFEQFREDNAAGAGGSMNDQYAEFADMNLHAPKGAEEIIKGDYQYAQILQETMDKAFIDTMDDYESVIADLKAKGIEINTDEAMKREDMASVQAMLATASTGVLDYDALAASLKESGEGSLSAYIGERLIAAHDAGIDVQEIEFESDRINIPKPSFERPDDKNKEQGGPGGMSSAFSTAQMQMVDYQNAQGLLQAADQGLIDENALNALIEQNAQNSGTMTARMMEYISTVQANGGD